MKKRKKNNLIFGIDKGRSISEEKEIESEISGEKRCIQVLTVEDCGIGMDRDIIERYFLQVGRSYYTTDEFRRTFSFVPTSQFGIGFLSVFAVSDHITVETYKPGRKNPNQAFHFSLTGPKSLLLTEKGSRKKCGTRIEVRLKDAMKPGELTDLVSNWCRRVEFPVEVDDLGTHKTIVAERPEDFMREAPELNKCGNKFIIRSFPINRTGIEGELYVLAYISDDGESWTKLDWATQEYPKTHPAAIRLDMPYSIECLHGIIVNTGRDRGSFRQRLDYRNARYKPVLSRRSRKFGYHHYGYFEMDPDIASRWREIISEHMESTPLTKGENGWRHKQQLIEEFPLNDFWHSIDGTIHTYVKGQVKLVSFDYMMNLSELTYIIKQHSQNKYIASEDEDIVQNWDNELHTIIDEDMRFVSSRWYDLFLNDRNVKNVRWLDSSHLAVDFTKTEDCTYYDFREHRGDFIRFIEYEDTDMVAGVLPRTHSYNYLFLFNTLNPLGKWIFDIVNRVKNLQSDKNQVQVLFNLLYEAVAYPYYNQNLSKLSKYLNGWQVTPGLQNYPPPKIELKPEMFKWIPPSLKEQSEYLLLPNY